MEMALKFSPAEKWTPKRETEKIFVDANGVDTNVGTPYTGGVVSFEELTHEGGGFGADFIAEVGESHTTTNLAVVTFTDDEHRITATMLVPIASLGAMAAALQKAANGLAPPAEARAAFDRRPLPRR